MNRADVWLGNNAPNAQPGNTEVRGMDTTRLIAARPFRIVVQRYNPETRATDQLPPQVVRLEILVSARQATELHDNAAEISRQYVVVIGNLNNPGVPDTDLIRADQFFDGVLKYTVVEFIETVPGRMMASAELTP